MDALSRHYDTAGALVDFVGNPAQSVAIVNQWAADRSGGRVDHILSTDEVPKETKLLASQVLTFAANWQHKFLLADTTPEDFHVDAQRTVKVPMMRSTQHLPYAATDDVEAVDIPFVGEALGARAFDQEVRGP